MSFSGNKSSFDRRQDDYKADKAERERAVVCKGLHYIHQTDKSVLVQEGEDLAGVEWKSHGRQVWLPKSQIRTEPSYNRYLERWDSLDKVELPKWLADERELFYE
jgi:hypothetical protein